MIIEAAAAVQETVIIRIMYFLLPFNFVKYMNSSSILQMTAPNSKYVTYFLIFHHFCHESY